MPPGLHHPLSRRDGGAHARRAPGLTDGALHRRYRVVAVDEEPGITLLRRNFGTAAGRYGEGNALMVWESFEVYGGEIHGVEALMKIGLASGPSGWDPDVRHPVHK